MTGSPTDNPVSATFPREPVYHDGHSYDTHLEQRRYDWCAVCPGLGLREAMDGPNQAYRALVNAIRKLES